MMMSPEKLESLDVRMVSFISSNYKSAYHLQAKGKSDIERLYLRLLLVTDYICGMTDSYAKQLYQELKAMVGRGVVFFNRTWNRL